MTSTASVINQKRLIAYIVPKPEKTINTIEIRRFLKDKIPDYMIPNTFVQIEAMPLTPNGKIDNAALPAPDTTVITPKSSSLNINRHSAPKKNHTIDTTNL